MKKFISAFLTLLMLSGSSLPAYAQSGSGWGLPLESHNVLLNANANAKVKVKVKPMNQGKKEKKERRQENQDNKDESQEDENESGELDAGGFLGVKNWVAFISEIHPEGNFLLVRKAGAMRRVNAQNAVIVKITANGARVISLSDLAVGAKARFWFGRIRGASDPNREVNAFLIIQQEVSAQPQPAPEKKPRVQFSSTLANGLESVADITIPVTLSFATTHDVKVHYSVSGGTATNGTDFSLLSGDLTIPAGQISGSIGLRVIDDGAIESNETVMVKLSDPENAVLGNNIYRYTIIDNDQPTEPTVQFSSAASSGLESMTTVNIPIVLSAASTHDVKVRYSATGGTAVGGSVDFRLSSGDVTIPAGQTSGNIVLTVTDDTTDEPDETVILTLSGAEGASLVSARVFTYTLLDND